MTHPWGGSLRRSLTGEETEDLKVIATSSTRDYFLSFKSNIDKVTFPTSPVTEIKSAKSRNLEHSIRETLWYYHIIFIYRKLRLIHSERGPGKKVFSIFCDKSGDFMVTKIGFLSSNRAYRTAYVVLWAKCVIYSS